MRFEAFSQIEPQHPKIMRDVCKTVYTVHHNSPNAVVYMHYLQEAPFSPNALRFRATLNVISLTDRGGDGVASPRPNQPKLILSF